MVSGGVQALVYTKLQVGNLLLSEPCWAIGLSRRSGASGLASELSPNFRDGRSRSGGGGCGLTVGRLGDDLDPVVECHTENEFWQLVGAVETAPAFLRGFQQFEDHRERGPWTGSPSIGSCGGARWRRCFQWGWWSVNVSSARPGSRRKQAACLDPCSGNRRPSRISACSSR